MDELHVVLISEVSILAFEILKCAKNKHDVEDACTVASTKEHRLHQEDVDTVSDLSPHISAMGCDMI